MNFKDKNGKLHEGIEDAEIADWMIDMDKNKKEAPDVGLQVKAEDPTVDPITGEIRRPEDCEGCSS